MQRLILVQSNEEIMPIGGLSLVGALLDKTGLNERLNKVPVKDLSNIRISNSDIIRSYLGLLCQGKNDFQYIEEFREDPFFEVSLGLDKVPSCSRLRQRMDLAPEVFKTIIKEESVDLLRAMNIKLTPCADNYIPLDIDVSPFDNSGTKKEGVSYTYKKFDGYAPIFAYLGVEGYCVNVELRQGSQHCQKDTPEFLRKSIKYSKAITSNPLLLRADSGNDATDNIAVCKEEDVDFIIKRNLRKESKELWLKIAQEKGEKTQLREGKILYLGKQKVNLKLKVKDQTKEIGVFQVFEVTKTTIADDGQYMLVPEIEVNCYWTSLYYDADKIVELYHKHGTSEQFHSEIKSDLDLERLPSGKFKTNDLILHLGVFAYNILRLIGQSSLKDRNAPIQKKVRRRRLKSVIRDMILMAAKLVKHAGSYFVKFGKRCKWFPVIRNVYDSIVLKC